MAGSPTQRSLKLMRSRGYTCQVVEHRVPVINILRDLFGFIDIVCIREGETVGVQTTAYSGVSARIRKIADLDTTDIVRAAGWKILVHGWRKVNGKWVVREVDIS